METTNGLLAGLDSVLNGNEPAEPQITNMLSAYTDGQLSNSNSNDAIVKLWLRCFQPRRLLQSMETEYCHCHKEDKMMAEVLAIPFKQVYEMSVYFPVSAEPLSATTPTAAELLSLYPV